MKKRFAKYRYQIIYTLVIIIIPLFIFAFSRWSKNIQPPQKEKSTSSKDKLVADKKQKIFTVSGFIEKIDKDKKTINMHAEIGKDDKDININITGNTVFAILTMGDEGHTFKQPSFESLKVRDFISVDIDSSSIKNSEFEALKIRMQTLPFSADTQ